MLLSLYYASMSFPLNIEQAIPRSLRSRHDNVIASIYIKEGKLSDYLRVLKANVPLVRKEKVCTEYVPATDIETGLLLGTSLYF